MTGLLDRALAACAKGLREFGYPDVTTDMVRQHHAAWKRGETAYDVIGMFVYRDFDERPELFGEQDL